MFESAISVIARRRGCMFSSVSFSGSFLKISANCDLKAVKAFVIGISRHLIPRLRATASASSMLPREEYGLGMETPITFSAPRASTAITATTAESTPPLKPSTADLKLHFRK